jgi:hypothetical protein
VNARERTELEVRYAEARSRVRRGVSEHADLSYEEGVANTLAWVLGKTMRDPLAPVRKRGNGK